MFGTELYGVIVMTNEPKARHVLVPGEISFFLFFYTLGRLRKEMGWVGGWVGGVLESGCLSLWSLYR